MSMKKGYLGPFYVEADMTRIWAAVMRTGLMLSLLAMLTHVISAGQVPERLRVLGIGPSSTAGQVALGVILTLMPVGLLLWHPENGRELRRGIRWALVLGAAAGLAELVRVLAGYGAEVDGPLMAQLCALSSHAVRSAAWLLIALHP
jgi:hypothetical protein